jgi:two-component system, NtrC family, sensor kinase
MKTPSDHVGCQRMSLSAPVAAPLDHARLREDRDRLQAIMDNCTAVIYLKDTAGRYLFINRQFETLFHIRRQEILGKTDFEIFPKVHAEKFRANDLTVQSSGVAMELEEVAPQDDGPHVYISLKFPLRDAGGDIYGVCGVSSDITAFKRIEEERNRFFDLTLDLLCVANFAGYFTRLNPSWERTLGWSRAELMARPYFDFIHPDDHAATRVAAAQAASGTPVLAFENRYRCADGGYRWLQWMAQPFPEQQLIFACARDVTQHKASQQKLAENEDELRKAAASERAAHLKLKKITSQLVQSEKLVALGQMVAGVAHEINNPLSYVTTNLAVLERDLAGLRELLRRYQEAERKLAPTHAEVFRSARACADEIDAAYTLANLEGLLQRSRDGLKRIQQIVLDLRDFARGSDKDWHEVDLNAGIESTLNILHLKAANKKVQLDKDLGALPPVRCCPAKINQVVLNLVANAIDACGEGGQVIVRTRAAGPNLEIHVLDNGSGIEPAICDRIFDPFFTTKPPGQGTGLGLSITHSIVADHGGTIDLDSTPGQGTHFTVTLPLR